MRTSLTHLIKTKHGDILLDWEDAVRLDIFSYKVGVCDGYPIFRGKMLHQHILEKIDGKVTDHINNNPLDNRRANLRYVTIQQNAWNKSLNKTYTTTGYKGCHVEERRPDGTPRRWRAEIVFNGVRYRKYNCRTPEDAARWYDMKARQFFGEYAWLNFPEDK